MISTYSELMTHFTASDGTKYRVRPADPDTKEEGYVIDMKGTYYSYCGFAVQWLPISAKPTYDDAFMALMDLDAAGTSVYNREDEKESPCEPVPKQLSNPLSKS